MPASLTDWDIGSAMAVAMQIQRFPAMRMGVSRPENRMLERPSNPAAKAGENTRI
jgi:hypothetical protein